ncbi:probable F-box protein At4g22060 isoform X2 [Humulus lupulus]|uniref:probable F-box protein At4g22060 isoform X2 n=1 Tax=Humulus lupulus TaxID=3486 RepID=UPI002B402E38|nr:probable F-box protein At4g22060 isoform X2 [Humulus lupulus]
MNKVIGYSSVMLVLNPIALMITMRSKIIRDHSVKEEEKKEEEEYCYDYRSWCDLPQDILSLIMEKLDFKDQAHFHAVCKRWQLVKGINRSQWLFYWFCSSTTVCKTIQKYYLYNLGTEKTYSIQNKVKHRCSGFSINSTYVYDWNSTCVAVKSGWLLLVKACCEAYYLYNAVTQEAISLPRKKIVREFGRSINDCFNYFELSLTQERRGRGHFVVYQVDKHIDLKNLILISTWRSAEKVMEQCMVSTIMI